MQVTRRDFLRYAGLTGSMLLSKKELAWGKSLLEPSNSEQVTEDVKIPTTCWIGKQDCGMIARRVNGRVVKFEGHPKHPRNLGTLCPKGIAQIIAVYDPYRVKAPLKRVNEKGKPGEWVEVSWNEALTTVAEKIKESSGKGTLLWQKGRSKAGAFYDNAFVKSAKAEKLGHGAYCSDAGYRACEYTAGLHGVLHPDFKHCRYLLSWGWNITNAGGNKLCWITWNRYLVEARERGMKVVSIDPYLGGAGHHADEWLPIKPGSDLAFFLALSNVLVEKGYIDREYLKKGTNAPFLVQENGYFLRINEKEQVWDEKTKSAKPYDEKDVEPALEGEFTVEQKVKTAFQLFREHIAKYPPEWASEITGLPAESIRKVAVELGENAMIGSKMVLEGEEYIYRPVGIMAYHVTQQEHGFQACRAALIAFMLLGAVEAVGGARIDFKRGVHDNFKKLDEIKIKDPPYNFYLKDSKYFPINSGNPSIAAKVMLDPKKYGVEKIPEVMIVHMTNSAVAFPPQDLFFEAYKKLKFIAVIDPWMSETADYFADILLPAATIEKYEGPLGATNQYEDATVLRLPPIEPLYKSKGEIDIYLDLCEKAGILYGEGGYLDNLNRELKLKEYRLDINKKPAVREIFDKWAKSEGIKEGIEYFEKNGVYYKGKIKAKDLYASAKERTSKGIYHRLYGESLKRYQDVMKKKGADEIYWRDYTPLPTWRNPTMDGSPSDFDLYLISGKRIEFKQSRSTFVPLLKEILPEQRLIINSKTARKRGLRDEDEVWVESRNAVTNETKKVKTKIKASETIRPDTVFMSHHYGVWVHPWAKNSGATPNQLFFSGEGYVSNTADQSFHVKVRVYK